MRTCGRNDFLSSSRQVRLSSSADRAPVFGSGCRKFESSEGHGGCSSAGRAPACGAGSRGIETHQPPQEDCQSGNGSVSNTEAGVTPAEVRPLYPPPGSMSLNHAWRGGRAAMRSIANREPGSHPRGFNPRSLRWGERTPAGDGYRWCGIRC